jgi:hypothetical protein
MIRFATASLLGWVILVLATTGTLHAAEVCSIIGGRADVADICVCPTGTAKKPLRGLAGNFICDDGTGAAQHIVAGEVCCLKDSGAQANSCKSPGAQFQWLPKTACMAGGPKAICPASSCAPGR